MHKVEIFNSWDELIKAAYAYVKRTGNKLEWINDPERGLSCEEISFISTASRIKSPMYCEINKLNMGLAQFVNQQDDKLFEKLEMLNFYA